MAQSPSHKLGQIIGTQFEVAVREPLKHIAAQYQFYLDYKHPRPARGGKKEVTWIDTHGNHHKLDYVIEEGGSEERVGAPRAFIEMAWRRYTKHSKNKVQEIQGALLPVAERYHKTAPFLGAILSGDFTSNAVEQLESHGFAVAYCSYETIVQAFQRHGLDVSSTENTSDAILQQKVAAFERSTETTRQRIRRDILQVDGATTAPFFSRLHTCLSRAVVQIQIFTLSGISHDFVSVEEAAQFVASYDESTPVQQFVRYEIVVRYSSGDEVRGSFQTKNRAVRFLERLHG